MTKRIFKSVFIAVCVIVVICMAACTLLYYEYMSASQENMLKTQLELAAKGVNDEGVEYLKGLYSQSYRLTYVDASGKVLYDTQTDASGMDNHAEREEIKQALLTGSGRSERNSDTLSEKTIYSALLLSNGNVLRISVTRYTVYKLFTEIISPLAGVLVAAVFLSLAVARGISRKIVEPINAINIEEPLENEAYEELSPLLLRIEQQHRYISRQTRELERKREEFEAVTANMSEGLILINKKGTVLSINPAACRLFSAVTESIGSDIITVNRDDKLQQVVKNALNGKKAEAVSEINGERYRLEGSAVASEGEIIGACIIAFNVTEKELMEQRRREFSANVSHELKTPLQAVIGSAELLKNGLVKQEDVKNFAGKIYDEASRLSAMVNDIIMLSALDEGATDAAESFDIKDLIEEVTASLEPAAKAAGVSVREESESVKINASRRLVYEIVSNLCENAVKYNKRGGSVSVKAEQANDGVIITVTDTGIGIPKEDINRVFERFYRVDKSRSKKTGGSGLGLSIVKHAVEGLGGSIRLTSEEGKGTEAVVTLNGVK